MNKIISIITCFAIITISAQEVDKDSLKTEEVHIIKPYTPKIKDAFKIKKNPILGDDKINEKKEVIYSINSFPVASTFTPSKGKAKGVPQKKRPYIYDNYLSVDFGNYSTPKVEAFAHTSSTRDNDFGVKVNFHSSYENIKEVKLNSDFTDFSFGAFYKDVRESFDWKTNIEYDLKKRNWYGLYENNTLTEEQILEIDPKQVYNTFNFDAEVKYYDSYFKGLNVNTHLLADAYSSSEFHILAVPQFEFPVFDEWLETDIRLEYLSGAFDKNYQENNEIKYNFFNLGISPKVNLTFDFLTLKIGASVVLSKSESDEKSKLFVYPDVSATYELIQDVVTLYSEVTGDLHQHSYKKFIANNPFVSPTLNIGRTNEKYNVKIGVKGKVATYISFNLNAFYKDENGKAISKLNRELAPITAKNYQYGNSFKVLYDNVKTTGVFGELLFDFTKEIQVGGHVNFNFPDLETLEEAWNLPRMESAIFAKYTSEKVTVGSNLFIVGESKEQYVQLGVIQDITNKSFMDLNVNVNYRFSNRLNIFIHGNNLLGNNYQRVSNYKIQGIQVLGGVKYKFDLP